MAITLEDLVKYGYAEDPNAFLQSEKSRIDAEFDQQMSQWRSNLEQAKQRGASDRLLASFERQYDRMMTRKENAYNRMESQFDRLTQRVEERLESPVFQRKVLQAQTQELQAQREEQAREQAAVAERQRQEREGMQREEAERQAGRFRARAFGGGRGVARPMLSAARMSPEQSLAPSQSLGAFMPK